MTLFFSDFQLERKSERQTLDGGNITKQPRWAQHVHVLESAILPEGLIIDLDMVTMGA